MDRLRAYILILHAMAERDRLKARIRQLEKEKAMASKFRGLAAAFRELDGDLNAAAERAIADFGEVKMLAHGAIDELGKELQAHKDSAADIEALLRELRADNGPPTEGSGN